MHNLGDKYCNLGDKLLHISFFFRTFAPDFRKALKSCSDDLINHCSTLSKSRRMRIDLLSRFYRTFIEVLPRFYRSLTEFILDFFLPFIDGLSKDASELQGEAEEIGAGGGEAVDIAGVTQGTAVEVALVMVEDIFHAGAELQAVVLIEVEIVRQA